MGGALKQVLVVIHQSVGKVGESKAVGDAFVDDWRVIVRAVVWMCGVGSVDGGIHESLGLSSASRSSTDRGVRSSAMFKPLLL